MKSVVLTILNFAALGLQKGKVWQRNTESIKIAKVACFEALLCTNQNVEVSV